MSRLILAVLVAATALGIDLPVGFAQGALPTLASRLGFPADAIVLIVNGDDLGVSHAANMASIASLERGLMTSATIMVPAPWSR